MEKNIRQPKNILGLGGRPESCPFVSGSSGSSCKELGYCMRPDNCQSNGITPPADTIFRSTRANFQTN